jgi:hypothetical protein
MNWRPVGTGEHKVSVVVGLAGQPTILLVATPAVGENTDQLRVESDQAPTPLGLGLAEDEPVVDGDETAPYGDRSCHEVDVGPPQRQRLSSVHAGEDVEQPQVVMAITSGVAQKDLKLSPDQTLISGRRARGGSAAPAGFRTISSQRTASRNAR